MHSILSKARYSTKPAGFIIEFKFIVMVLLCIRMLKQLNDGAKHLL